MSISADDLLSFADDLLRLECCGEVYFRAAASRAYYAAFHAASDFAEALDLESTISNTGEHERLASRFKSCKRHKAIAAMLAATKKVRVEVDYKLCDPFSRAEATKQVAASRSIVNELKRLLAAQTGT